MPRPKILVLDDSETVLEATEAMLSAGGFDVVTVNSWATLAGLLAREAPDLALIDVSMPILRGDSIVEAFSRGGRSPIPLVLYSDQPEQELQRLARACGAAGYICKTSDGAELGRSVSRLLQPAAPRPSIQGPAARGRPIALFTDDRALALPAGLEVVTLPSGPAGRASLEQLGAALVLVDLDGPAAEGSARELRGSELGRSLPLLAISAVDGPLELRRATRCFADDFLLKGSLATGLPPRLAALAQPPVVAPLVLLADPNPMSRSALVRLAESCGFAVQVASTGRDLLALVTGRGPELKAVLADPALVDDLGALSRAVSGRGAALITLHPTATVPHERAAGVVAAIDKSNVSDVLTEALMAACAQPTRLKIANRSPFLARVDFEVPGGVGGAGFCVEASLNGLFIHTLVPVPSGRELLLRIFFSGRQVLECRGKVAWSNPFAPPLETSRFTGMAVEFLSLEGGLAELLSRHTSLDQARS